MNMDEYRKQEFYADTLFSNRWSPRAMSDEAIDTRELMRLFEAARWAPSAFNNQPWRFLYAMKESDHWDPFFSLLIDTNKVWAKNAAALIVIISKENFDYNGKPSRTHSLDTGAAWQNMALQGSLMGLVVHGMQGFDYERAKTELKVKEGYTVEAMVAVGREGNKEDLPEELREREVPSGRKKISEIAFEGTFME